MSRVIPICKSLQERLRGVGFQIASEPLCKCTPLPQDMLGDTQQEVGGLGVEAADRFFLRQPKVRQGHGWGFYSGRSPSKWDDEVAVQE